MVWCTFTCAHNAVRITLTAVGGRCARLAHAIHGAASLASGMKRRIASKAASALAGAPSPVEASEATTARPSVPASTLAGVLPPHATPDATVIARTENANQIGSLTIERPLQRVARNFWQQAQHGPPWSGGDKSRRDVTGRSTLRPGGKAVKPG